MYATADLRHQETTAFRLEIDDQRLLDFRIQATTIDRFPSSSCAGGCRQTAAQGQGNRERACLIAMITLPLLRVRTGMHSVQPVAISVSTIVCTKLPDQDVPECAQQSRAADLSNRRRCGLAPSGELPNSFLPGGAGRRERRCGPQPLRSLPQHDERLADIAAVTAAAALARRRPLLTTVHKTDRARLR
ncbi:hypothetical protein [Mesorhizobium sp.]|uniref:hypothetical protein n=2 Tax=Mesorhizobium sp. TaxID=1871066 RepID=UPI00257F0AAF|nr:hypothetical protein [Mesorhizobium sp.]